MDFISFHKTLFRCSQALAQGAAKKPQNIAGASEFTDARASCLRASFIVRLTARPESALNPTFRMPNVGATDCRNRNVWRRRVIRVCEDLTALFLAALPAAAAVQPAHGRRRSAAAPLGRDPPRRCHALAAGGSGRMRRRPTLRRQSLAATSQPCPRRLPGCHPSEAAPFPISRAGLAQRQPAAAAARKIGHTLANQITFDSRCAAASPPA